MAHRDGLKRFAVRVGIVFCVYFSIYWTATRENRTTLQRRPQWQAAARSTAMPAHSTASSGGGPPKSTINRTLANKSAFPSTTAVIRRIPAMEGGIALEDVESYHIALLQCTGALFSPTGVKVDVLLDEMRRVSADIFDPKSVRGNIP